MSKPKNLWERGQPARSEAGEPPVLPGFLTEPGDVDMTLRRIVAAVWNRWISPHVTFLPRLHATLLVGEGQHINRGDRSFKPLLRYLATALQNG